MSKNNLSLPGWLEETIPLHLDWVNTFKSGIPGLTREEVFRLWLMWNLANKFVGVFGVQEGYVIARPVPYSWLFDTTDYFKRLFEFNSLGDTMWIDTIWAPGHYPQVLQWLRRWDKPKVGWSHKGKMFVTELSKLSGERPVREQIRGSLTPQ